MFGRFIESYIIIIMIIIIIIIVQLVGAMRTKKSNKLFVLASVDRVICVPLAPSETPFTALTATSQTRQKILEGLSLKDNLKCIIASPNRPNIYL